MLARTARHLALQRGDLDFQPLQVPCGVLDDRRGSALPQRHLGAGGIQHPHRLVRQLAAADVAMRQPDRLGDGLIQHPDAEVLFHQRHHPAQHGGGQRLGRFLHLHHLEAAGQRGVLFKVLLVLGPGRGGDGPQLAAGQGRLEQVGSIVLPRRSTGADHGVRFVDEQDDRMRALLDLVDHVLEPVLELALHAGARLQQAHVQHVQFHALQHLRHVLPGDAQGQAFHHRGFAHAGLAGENGVVLPAAQQNVHQLADLRIATDHRIDMAIAGPLGQVGGELVERRSLRQPALARLRHLSILRFPVRPGIGESDRLAAFLRAFGQRAEVVLELLALDAGKLLGSAEGQLRQVGLGQQGQQQVPAADAGGTRIQRCQQPGMFKQGRQVRREHRGAGVAVAEPGDFSGQVFFQGAGGNATALRNQGKIAPRLLQQRQKQVLKIDLVVAAGHAQAGGALGRQAAAVVELADQCLEIDVHALKQRSMSFIAKCGFHIRHRTWPAWMGGCRHSCPSPAVRRAHRRYPHRGHPRP